MWKFKKESRALNLLIIFLIAILSGIVGSLIVKVYVPDYSDVSYLIFGQERPREVVITKDEQISKIISDYENGIVSIYIKLPKTQDVFSQSYTQKNYLGNAVILTSDGWLLTSQNVIKGYSKEGIVAAYNQDIYEIEEIVNDLTTDIVFIKLSAEKNLQNVKIIEFSDNPVLSGSQALVLSQHSNYITNIENPNFSNVQILSTDYYYDFIKLQDNLPDDYMGSPIIGLDGKVAGIFNIDENNLQYVIKAEYFKNKYKDVIKDQEISVNEWGINYIDLSKTTGPEIIYNNEKLKRGVLIYSLNPDGLFYNSELQKGDIILKIEDDEIKDSQNLKDILDEYAGLESIKIEFIRDGEWQETSLNIK